MFTKEMLYITFYFQDVIITAKDFKNFGKTKIRNIFYMLDPLKMKKTLNYVKTTEFSYDTGLIWEESNKEQFYMLDEIDKDEMPKVEGLIYNFVMFQSERKDFYYLTYLKMSTIIAQVAGFANVLIITFFILSSLYTPKEKIELEIY